ncbi:hypothetical protein Ocin01_04021 [Orchesella cincta]|uniref:Secreted protein n=1 Tax=Orchesella cincta TaxID=48709 RepID=A0A1D2NBM7_ORCCI|nr:hypothetical protein Ocin01_04021 [Orchesella cincta]
MVSIVGVLLLNKVFAGYEFQSPCIYGRGDQDQQNFPRMRLFMGLASTRVATGSFKSSVVTDISTFSLRS